MPSSYITITERMKKQKKNQTNCNNYNGRSKEKSKTMQKMERRVGNKMRIKNKQAMVISRRELNRTLLGAKSLSTTITNNKNVRKTLDCRAFV